MNLIDFALVKSRFEILTTPLHSLSFLERSILRMLLFFVAPLINMEHEERIPPDPVIFAFNHNSSYETMFIVLYLVYKRQGEKVHFFADWMYGYLPIVGWFVRMTEPIFVYHKRARFGFLNRIKQKIEQRNSYLESFLKLKQNHCIGIFPEGTRNRDPYQLKPGRKGIGKIALKTGVPVLPIGIDFPKRSLSGKIPKFGSLIFRVGEKLTFENEIAIVRDIIKSDNLTSSLKSRLLDYYDEKVTYDVMAELAKLSGKIYPFNPPQAPTVGEWNPDNDLDIIHTTINI